jgi:hypothetical protein
MNNALSHLIRLIEWVGKELKTAGIDAEAEFQVLITKIRSHV